MPGFGEKIFIGSADKALRKRLKNILCQQGDTIVGEEEDGHSALRTVRRVLPDLVILDRDLPGLPGMEVAKIIEEDKIAPVIILTPFWEREMVEKSKDSWVFAFLVKPVQEGHLLATASFVLNAFQKMKRLEAEVDGLKETLESRKVVEKAKGLMMKSMKISETEAYKLLQKRSMDKCVPMKQVAEAIILAYEINKN